MESPFCPFHHLHQTMQSFGICCHLTVPGYTDEWLGDSECGEMQLLGGGKFRSVQRRGGGYRLIRLVVRNDASYDESCARGAPPGGG
ncbi:hypothetical protein CYMTET_10296 [Cymbomonas tetramitiformis]|uniref:Uncharacterized protein n=1 Tax=Cymbomonas tetramitiformis TaxID=36881 RepID=A0AAE0LE56_9CHLO|nr:hypothetical protein CYMTET_10296 [Cymbomonas tetramitiformis]